MSKKLYSIDIPVFATVYIKAKSREKALAILREQLAGTGINTEELTSSFAFKALMESPYPEHNVTISPIMTIPEWEYIKDDPFIEKVYP
jgi:hypothetical protein